MMIRVLALALLCACTCALTPLSAAADDNECALYLSGPGRTSAYDYSLNLLKGNFGYEGQHTCITYDAVNQAYLEARNRIVVSQPKGEWKPEHYASVGELILDISINLARTYGLTYEEIEKGLPLIDTSRTLIREVCPPVFSHVECRAGKFRRLDGLCNNLEHPTWGSINAPFQRLIGPLFSDGINAPRIAHTGRDLPLSRVVSRTMHPDDGFHDHAGTVMVIAWGQFMDHDYTLTGTPLDPVNRNDPEECCKRPLHLKHPYCNEIVIPDDDYFYRLFGVKCIDFVRGFPSPRPGCRLGSRVPFNTLTGAIDGNTVYGVTDKFSRKLRTGYGGLLRMNPVFKEYGLKDLLPLKLDIPDEGCTRPNKNMYCFEAGEIRVNEQLVLTVMHTLMAREHNRVAESLSAVNPHWDDETLFQEARRINIAEIQHITYNEFLPILLGKDVMDKFGLVLEKEGYWDGYDSNVNPDVIASFAAAAYRFGHSLLPTAVERWSKAHKFIASKRLSDLIRRPYDLYRAGVLDEYVMGLMNQVAQAMDDSITQEVTNHLFKKIGARFGMDLVSFNMQRGREFGLPGYMEFRKFCGLPGANSFQDLFGTMSNETVRKYETIFEHPIDVDLWSGGVSERPLPGSMLGPTFACIIATQFSYSRRGDRFWFELPQQPSSFTSEQLAEIRKSRLARIICDNTDIIDTVQLYPFVLPDHELNPRVPCRSGILPQMDFSKWAEPAPFHSAKEFITEAYVLVKNESISNNSNANHNHSEDQNDNILKAGVGTSNVNNIGNILSNETLVINTKGNCSLNNSCLKNEDDSKSLHETDTVLKYVYKKNENKIIHEKPTGHAKNSVTRRKRSLKADSSSPLIVNYETIHTTDGTQNPYERIRNTIKNSDIADFNIETKHENPPLSNQTHKTLELNELKNNDDTSTDADDDANKGRGENVEHRINKLLDLDSRDNDDSSESSERQNPPNSRSSHSTRSSDESHNKLSEEDVYPNKKQNDNESYVRDKDNSKENEENNSETSGETREISSNSKESYSKPNNRQNGSNKSEQVDSNSEESDDKENKSSNNSFDSKNSIENKGSEKADYHKHRQGSANYGENYSNSFRPDQIRDVDINDFTYENVHVNNKGLVEPTLKERKNESERSNLADIDDNVSILVENADESQENNDNKNPIQINDNEVKPVVEINSDVVEAKEENNKEALKSNSQEEDVSLETFLGVKKDPEQNTEKKFLKEEKIKGNVKEQFERIPSHYKHDDNTKQQENKPYSKSEEQSDTDENKSDGEGTLDILTPKDHKYDEHLNIKFDDVAIKLPDIHLPDDIVAYAHEKPENKEKSNFFKYNDDYEDESNEEKNKKGNNDESGEDKVNRRNNNDDNNNHSEENSTKESNDNNNSDENNFDDDHYYHDKKEHRSNDYKQNDDASEENDDDEDLYEKFVRERFGKKGSFKKRSENLQIERPEEPDSQLFNALQGIRKKTSEHEKEAENSGDPNANYMWTLEYGQGL